MTTQHRATRVLIIGAGPVGLTLAIDLAWRGIDVTLVERRHAGEAPEPKCNHVSARSMEIFRRLGIAAKLRNVGLPEDYPNAVSYRTSFTGIEFARIHIPCRRDRYTDKSGADGNWPTPEPPHRVNQTFLEPVLFEYAAALPRVTILNRTQVESFEQSDDEVIATVRNLDTGETVRIACCYLVGCDGGRSTVRRAIGAQPEGDAVIQRVQATFIRAPGLIGLQQGERSWMTNAVNPRRVGNVIAIDGRERWLIFNYLKPDEADFDAVDRDGAIRTILGVGPEFRYQVLSKEDWYGRRLIANKFRQARVFIAGDAAHIWVPYAGYGMNAGIGDAANLAWLLAAHLDGWAPAENLDAYEAERQPITEQVSRFAMAHADSEIERRGAVPPDIELPGPAGDAVRTRVGRAAYDLNVQQFCCGGLNFGYFYDRSPIIMYDAGEQPAYTMVDFTSSTVPGCCAPHFWLRDGRSVYDLLGPGYTLLCLDPKITTGPLEEAADRDSVPLSVVQIEVAPEPYEHKLVLVRTDQHVAWRGNAFPKTPTHSLMFCEEPGTEALRPPPAVGRCQSRLWVMFARRPAAAPTEQVHPEAAS